MSDIPTTAARVWRQAGWLQTPQAVPPGQSMAPGVPTVTTPRPSPPVFLHTPITQHLPLPHRPRHKPGAQRQSQPPQAGAAHTHPRTSPSRQCRRWPRPPARMTARRPPRRCPRPRCTRQSRAWRPRSTSSRAGHPSRRHPDRRSLCRDTGDGTRSSRRTRLSSRSRILSRNLRILLSGHGVTPRRRPDTEARVLWRRACRLLMVIIIRRGHDLGRSRDQAR